MANFEAETSCACGRVRSAVDGVPLFRAYCHCTICQAFNQAERADIVVMRSTDVTLTGRDQIAFKFHQTPPLLNRGTCTECGGAAVETMNLPLLPNLTIIPAQTIKRSDNAPEPIFHMFYHRRISDADDSLPKYASYLRSQWGFSSAVLRALRRTRARR